MNTTVPFNPATPSLKLPRRSSTTTEAPAPEVHNDLAGQLAADLETLREREENLRKYEVRLRDWQAQLDATVAQTSRGSGTPFPRPLGSNPFAGQASSADPALEAAWSKFHRARALLEAEQNQLRDDRLAFRDLQAALEKRSAELAAREAALAEREEALAMQNSPAPSAMQRLTQAPFLAAKAVFRSTR
jgi:DNA repair exonuclease SbcCD ATPase subunit